MSVSRDAWITPDEIPTDLICRVLYIPNDSILIANVTGALLPLAYPDNWEQVGAATPEECAQAMLAMFGDFVESECQPTMPVEVYFTDVKNQNTHGGAFNSGAWRIRDLNQIGYTEDVGASLSNNEFTLPPGTWRIEWDAPARLVDHHQTRLFSVTENQQILPGTSEYAPNADNQTRSFGIAVQTNSANTTYRIEHRCQITRATDGFGVAANFTMEVYTRVKCTLIAPYS